MDVFFKNKEQEMLSLLERLVNIDSGSMDKEGVDTIGDLLKKEYEKIGFHVETIQQDLEGNLFID